jgi:hypothetical protein
MDEETGTLAVDRFLCTPSVILEITGSCRTPYPMTRPDRRTGGEYAAVG